LASESRISSAAFFHTKGLGVGVPLLDPGADVLFESLDAFVDSAPGQLVGEVAEQRSI
jgi:hypothetical protein